MGEESLGAHQSESERNAWRRSAETLFNAALQVRAARLRGALPEEAAHELHQLEERIWELLTEAAMQVRPEGR